MMYGHGGCAWHGGQPDLAGLCVGRALLSTGAGDPEGPTPIKGSTSV